MTPIPDATELAAMRPALRLIALRALGDPDAAEDVAQETLARALSAVQAGRLRDHTRLAAFVHGIARHVILDVMNAQRRRGTTDITELPVPTPDALASLVATEDLEALRFAMRQLGEEELALLRLLFVEGLTSAEAAQRLAEPADRIRKRKSRLMERLRAFFHANRGGVRHEIEPAPTTPAAPQMRGARGVLP